MAGFSNYLRNKILDHLFGKSTYTTPTVYVALSTANPLGDGSGIAEPSGNGYARVASSSSDWSDASSFEIQNAATITFPTATGSWGTIAYFALYDAASGGNLLVYGTLSTSSSIISGQTPAFASGDLSITH
jgi:hypothetical protein